MVKLISDFSELYDNWFDGEAPEFRRMTTEGPDRLTQFKLLAQAGYNTPPHGLVGDVLNLWWDAEGCWIDRVVAYEDINSHCGEAKRIVSTEDFRRQGGRMNPDQKVLSWANLPCSAYVGRQKNGPPELGVSWRHLQIGTHVFWVEYHSKTDWRSNCGDGSIEVIEANLDAGYHPFFRWPLFAIDFVWGKSAKPYAVDLNTAPGIGGVHLENWLSHRQIAGAIKNAMHELG